MKKFLSIICTAAIVMSLVACGSPAAKEDQSAKADESEKQEAVQEEEFKEAVVVDNDSCKFVITEIDPDGDWGYTLKVLCENKTDTTVMFSWDNVSVNGFMIDPFWASEVAGGKKSIEEISFSANELKESGIDNVENIEFELRVYESEEWLEEPYVDEVFTYVPGGEVQSGHSGSTASADSISEDMIIVDNEYCTFAITGVDPNGDWGYTVKAVCINKTDANLMFSWEDVSVNDIMVDPFWASEVAPGKQSNEQISFFESDLEENGITSVDKIEYKLNIYNSDDWDIDPYVNAVYTFEPEK